MAIRAHPLVFGTVVFLASESMLFAGLLAAWYDLRGLAEVWPPPGIELDLVGATAGTILLGIGSVTMTVAQISAGRGRRDVARAMLVLTLGCALAFAAISILGYAHANFQVDSNAYGTLYYVLTGTHLAHVIAGAVLLCALAVFLGRRAFTRDHHAGVEAIAYYWHFVFVVWLAVYASIYLVR